MSGNMVLNVEILGEFKKLTAATTGASKQLNGINKTASKISRTMTSALAAIGVGFSLNAVVNGVKDVINAASDLGEATNAINVAFGKSSKEIIKFGESAAEAVGLSKTELYGIATQFSSFAKQIGGEGGATDVIEELATRGADFASVFNLDVSDALGKFQSGLAGQSEPLRAFGIDLSAAAVEAYALSEGIFDGEGSMTEAEKVMARYGLLMQETAITAGDFANTSDGLANTQRILKAEFENVKAEVGEALLPIMIDLFTEIRNNMPTIKAFIQAFIDGVVWVAKYKDTLIPVVTTVVALTAAWKAYNIVAAIASNETKILGVSMKGALGAIGAVLTALQAIETINARIRNEGGLASVPQGSPGNTFLGSTAPTPSGVSGNMLFGSTTTTTKPPTTGTTSKPPIVINNNTVVNTASTNASGIVSSLQGYQNQNGATLQKLLK